MSRHLTRHGGPTTGDAIDCYVEETRLLRAALDNWRSTRPDGDVDTAWKHGTIDKLLIEHTAVRVAATDDIIRVLRAHDRPWPADQLDERRAEVAATLDRLATLASGVTPIPLAATTAFDDTVVRLRSAVADEPADGDLAEHLAGLVGEHRGELRSGRYIRKHAPTHPGTRRRWYQRLPFVVRAHAAYDRLRGFPWAESTPIADGTTAEHLEPGQ